MILIKFDPKLCDFSDVNITSSWDKGFIYVQRQAFMASVARD